MLLPEHNIPFSPRQTGRKSLDKGNAHKNVCDALGLYEYLLLNFGC